MTSSTAARLSPPVPKNAPYIMAVVAMMAVACLASVVLLIFRPGPDNAATIALMFGFLTTTTFSLLAFMKAQDTHVVVNSRMDEFKQQLEQAAEEKAVAARVAGVADGRRAGVADANARTDRLAAEVRVALLPALRILVVDDDPSTSQLVDVLLRADGMDVRSVQTEDAMQAVLATWTPDLIVMDLRLQGPTDSGAVITRRLKAAPATAAIPVVLFSSHPLIQQEVREIGAVGAIWKPLDPRIFAATIRQYVSIAEGGATAVPAWP